MKKIIAWVIACLLVAAAAGSYIYVNQAEKQRSAQLAKAAAKTKKMHQNHMRYPIDWKKSSQTISYPKIQHPRMDNLKVKVSLARQRLYIFSKNEKIYTMYISASWKKAKKSNRVVPGNYRLQDQRGSFYYTPAIGEGGKYWVAWKKSGQNLIQSVPINEQRNFLQAQASLLGDTQDIPNTHGNIWLAVKDAKWFYNNIPGETKLIIRR
jgi:lipoprotein-anchoring transpeptidase ErfK/SrfK